VRVPIPCVAARSTDQGPLEIDLCVEVPPNGKPRIAYQYPGPDDRDAHGNLWVRMSSAGEGGRVLYHSMHPARQRECMENLLCQVCAEPALREAGTLFIEWQRPDEPPMRLDRLRTDMPPVCPTCAALSLRHCPVLRDDVEPVLLLVRKSVVCGVSGNLYRVKGDFEGWIEAEADVYSSYNKPRYPGLIAQRSHRKLRGVTVVDPESLAAGQEP